MKNLICTSTWGPGDEVLFLALCDMARYRAAEPKKPQMICPAKLDGRCKGGGTPVCEPHEQDAECGTVWHCYIRGAHPRVPGPCVPVLSPAPVREIDRAELQRKIVHAHLAAEFLPEPHQKILHGLVDDLEALASGKARIKGNDKGLFYCYPTARVCNKLPGLPDCDRCDYFQEAATEWARNENWTEPK